MKNKTKRTAKRQINRKRPVHKKVLLHPITVFLLLCVGVLALGATWHSKAESYNVTATVPAPPLTEPASITSPDNQAHVTAEPIAVSGTCPGNSYVEIYRDGVFAGMSLCEGGQFNLEVSLREGGNQLDARVFNVTNQEGPDSPPITVYFDIPSTRPEPSSTPINLSVFEAEEEKVVEFDTSRPTITGVAPPFSDVTVTFYSDPVICKTKANSKGVWSCTLYQDLPAGLHHVVVEAITPAGKKLTFDAFQIAVKVFAEAFFLTSDYKYQKAASGQKYSWNINISGGTPPFNLTVDWGDGTTTNYNRAGRDQFEISHSYTADIYDRNLKIMITAVDDRGASSILQLAVLVKGTGATVAATSPIDRLLGDLGHYLWVIWPVYIAVVLMAFSFWLGEREAVQHLIGRRKRKAH